MGIQIRVRLPLADLELERVWSPDDYPALQADPAEALERQAKIEQRFVDVAEAAIRRRFPGSSVLVELQSSSEPDVRVFDADDSEADPEAAEEFVAEHRASWVDAAWRF